jgi:DNA-binding CsgD family transcriptional regulator
VKTTQREREILSWIAEGKTAGETGSILGISKRTVEWHLQNMRCRLKATNVVHCVAMAVRYGVIGVCGTGICGIGIAAALESPTICKWLRDISETIMIVS